MPKNAELNRKMPIYAEKYRIKPIDFKEDVSNFAEICRNMPKNTEIYRYMPKYAEKYRILPTDFQGNKS